MVFGTVLRTFCCAVFGAIFGYILGFMIELFPGFNMALLNGLHTTLGMSIVSMPALLAALGLLAGTLLGVILSIMIAGYGKYAKYAHGWFGYPHRHHHYRHYARYWHHYGSRCEPWDYTIEDTLGEMDGYVSYLEDLPEDRLKACQDKIGRLNERLSDLKASLNNNKSS